MNSDGNQSYPNRLRNRVREDRILPLIGIYDVFSGTLAARHFEAVFCSGYGLSASYYGLPDAGYLAWPEVLSWVERLRFVAPQTHIFVDIDDGYADENTVALVTRRLERAGASAVIFEDQRRPKRCGHLGGKDIIPLDEYLERLDRLLAARDELFVVARTDAADATEGLRRAKAFAEAGADAVLVEGIKDLGDIPAVRQHIGTKARVLVNLIAGGKTPPVSLGELHGMGVDIVNFSTPCLFAAQEAMDTALRRLLAEDGRLEAQPAVGLAENNRVLEENLRRTGLAKEPAPESMPSLAKQNGQTFQLA